MQCGLVSVQGLKAVRIYTDEESKVLLFQPASSKEAATKASLGVLPELLRLPAQQFTQYFPVTA